MRKIAVLIFASLLLTACGDDGAPDGAVVTGPGDGSLTFTKTSNAQVFPSFLTFKVKDGLKEDAHLLADVEITLIANRPAYFSDLTGTPLSTPTFIRTNTDDRGLATVVASIEAPGCTGAAGEADIVAIGSVLATVGTADAIWSGTLTIKCATGTTETTP